VDDARAARLGEDVARFQLRGARLGNGAVGAGEGALGLRDGEGAMTRRSSSASNGRQQSPKEK
jgi:hypothetical protein